MNAAAAKGIVRMIILFDCLPVVGLHFITLALLFVGPLSVFVDVSVDVWCWGCWLFSGDREGTSDASIRSFLKFATLMNINGGQKQYFTRHSIAKLHSKRNHHTGLCKIHMHKPAITEFNLILLHVLLSPGAQEQSLFFLL